MSLSSVEKTLSSLSSTLTDAVTFLTIKLNNPTESFDKLELVLDVLLSNWRQLDQSVAQLKVNKEKFIEVKDQWQRQISHFDFILQQLKNGNLFDKNEQLIQLSILLHRPYLREIEIKNELNKK